MKIDVNHPSFVKFTEHVINNITTNVSVEKYFKNNKEQKLTNQLQTIKVIDGSLKKIPTFKFDKTQYNNFIDVLLKKSESVEKYELSSLMKDILNNFDSLYEGIKTVKKPTVRKISTKNKMDEN